MVKNNYKPYKPAEFQQRWKLGDVITIRKKSEPLNVFNCLITEYRQIMTQNMNEPEHYVKMGSIIASLNELYNDYEYLEESEWIPFGVKR